MNVPLNSASAAALSALALCLAAGSSAAAPVIEVKPGLWATESEVWINGQSLQPSLKALRDNVRSGLTEAQKAELDSAANSDKQACLSPQQARIDLATYLESALGSTGPWQCKVNPGKLDTTSASGTYACRTNGGGLTQGKFDATYSPTAYRLEVNGRGNLVDGRSGAAMGGTEMDQRMLSTGRWIKSGC